MEELWLTFKHWASVNKEIISIIGYAFELTPQLYLFNLFSQNIYQKNVTPITKLLLQPEQRNKKRYQQCING